MVPTGSGRPFPVKPAGRDAPPAGFTLVELVVVVAIIAILATVGFLALSGYSSDASKASVRANVRLLASAVASESAKNGDSPRRYVVLIAV